jgi:hypothetical protein
MDDQLKLAESYYAVASHLKQQAEHYSRTADLLNGMADAICEMNIREKGKSAPSVDGSVRTPPSNEGGGPSAVGAGDSATQSQEQK